jgi:hypothetical protein
MKITASILLLLPFTLFALNHRSCDDSLFQALRQTPIALMSDGQYRY